MLLNELVCSQVIETYTIKVDSGCINDESLVVLSGAQIPALSGHNIARLSLLNYSQLNSQEKLQAIVFQVDQKDTQGRYFLTENYRDKSNNKNTLFTDNDELVFRRKDLKNRIDYASELLKKHTLIELEIITDSDAAESGNRSKWLYIELDVKNSLSASERNHFLSYEHEQDCVTSSIYKIGFSKAQPFLLDSFHWRLPEQSGWSDDMTDTMKIRHLGKFFGLPFKRTQNDYHSHLIAVKEGPLRIIRRTENRIKVFWKLKSPALFIDYVMMPDGFVMDTMIDIPFNISFFSVIWRQSPRWTGIIRQKTMN